MITNPTPSPLKKITVVCSLLAIGSFVMMIGLFPSQRREHADPIPLVGSGDPESLPAIPTAAVVQQAERLAEVPRSEGKAPRGNVFAAQKSGAPKPVTEPQFADFNQWSGKYLNANPRERAGLESEGVELAQARRSAMAEMIQKDPERALQLALPYELRTEMPSRITSLLEERVGGRGRIEVGIATGPERVVTTRDAYLGNRKYNAFTYGRREYQRSRDNVVMQGIAVDGVFAVDENPVRVLDPKEAAVKLASIKSETICSISKNPVTSLGEETLVQAGGELALLCGNNHVTDLDEQLAEQEFVLAVQAQSLGANRLLIISAKFGDAGAPAPASQTDLITSFHTRADDFYQENSYGDCSLAPLTAGGSKFVSVTLPHVKSYYNGQGYSAGSTDLKNDAIAQANLQLAPETVTDYDIKSIAFQECGNWFYWAYAMNASTLFNGKFSANTVMHEHGHSFGMSHAGAWMSNTSDPIGGNRLKKTYGDIFDSMGNSSLQFGNITNWGQGIEHYNIFHKMDVGWIRSGDWVDVTTTSSTNRLYSGDKSAARGGIPARTLALQILRPSSGNLTNYWLGYRQRFTTNDWLLNGVQVHLKGPPMIKDTDYGNADTVLIDMTPNSRGRYTGTSVIDQDKDMDDSALVIGKTFSDTAESVPIHITPIATGSQTISGKVVRWIDVVIHKGSFPNRVNPTASWTTNPGSGNVNTDITFALNTSNNNGDQLSFYWDFSESGSYNIDFQSSNTGSIIKRWSTTGTKTVRCVVSDLKGRTLIKTTTINIQ
jgi:hypothetical protein